MRVCVCVCRRALRSEIELGNCWRHHLRFESSTSNPRKRKLAGCLWGFRVRLIGHTPCMRVCVCACVWVCVRVCGSVLIECSLCPCYCSTRTDPLLTGSTFFLVRGPCPGVAQGTLPRVEAMRMRVLITRTFIPEVRTLVSIFTALFLCLAIVAICT